MADIYGDFETFVHDNSERLFRYLVYKRSYTPYEVERKYIDQSEFEDNYFQFGFIKECIPLGKGDYLLGIHPVYDQEDMGNEDISYYKLSELRISYNPNDIEDFVEF